MPLAVYLQQLEIWQPGVAVVDLEENVQPLARYLFCLRLPSKRGQVSPEVKASGIHAQGTSGFLWHLKVSVSTGIQPPVLLPGFRSTLSQSGP